ncbi:hypothetical protein BJX61DRAFT_535904 [Aspergillus egyptiacus]|nr:hypothetical protein BJX61DRAFT_535904 [Aspergillus egyptiacus]
MNWFFLRALELLASPTFHRMVGDVHRKIRHLRHGSPPDEMGGTRLENNGPGLKKFFQYFGEEIKEQLKGKRPDNKS